MFDVRQVLACTWLAGLLAVGLGCAEANRGEPKAAPAGKPADPVAEVPAPRDQPAAVGKAGDTPKPADKADAPAKPLTEAELVSQCEVQTDVQVVLRLLDKRGIAFPVDDALLDRMKKASVPQAVLVWLQRKRDPVEPTPDQGGLTLFVSRPFDVYGKKENFLHTELSINGKVIGTFTAEHTKVIEPFMKKGWNTITMKTTAKEPATSNNWLDFTIGSVKKADANTPKMSPVLWSFTNSYDWTRKGDHYAHRLGPDTKVVTLTLNLYYAGMELEGTEAKKGDYVVQSGRGSPTDGLYGLCMSSVTTTVIVNGTPVNSFMGCTRRVKITPLLKQGRNEVEIVTHRIKDLLNGTTEKFDLGGPAEWNPGANAFEFKPLLPFDTTTGWERDPKSLQMGVVGKPGAESHKRVLSFMVEELPKN